MEKKIILKGDFAIVSFPELLQVTALGRQHIEIHLLDEAEKVVGRVWLKGGMSSTPRRRAPGAGPPSSPPCPTRRRPSSARSSSRRRRRRTRRPLDRWTASSCTRRWPKTPPAWT